MSSSGSLNPESDSFESRPVFYIGQHDSTRREALTDDQYGQVLSSGFRFVTAPITNQHFFNRVVDLHRDYLKEREQWAQQQGPAAGQQANPSLPAPVVPTLTDKDTSLFPGGYLGSLALYSSPWIDLCSPDPHISSISRQVLNLEAAYANFCGARTIVVPGPRQDDSSRGIAQYARAIREAMHVANRANVIIHMPMYREPGLEEKAETLSSIFNPEKEPEAGDKKEVDLFSAWDSWNTIRSVCSYSMRLFVAIRIPRRVPEKTLQERWFAEPLHYLTISQEIFQLNRAGHPSLSRHHQDLINRYMRLRSIPWLMLCDVGPRPEELATVSDESNAEFPSLAEANQALKENRRPHMSAMNAHVGYMRYLERQQPPFSAMETPALTSFQDWLQPPLQPLADNLESATYEVFEGDPVKYDQYEKAITEAMIEWRELKKPTSTATPENPSSSELVVTVAGAGRGPLVSRALRAAESTGTPIQIWALEKNQDAYVYLLRKNKVEWGNKVTLVKTDMRGWEGPRLKGREDAIGKVDILVTELLGSFGDNELSPECLDGIQNHLARPHGISIPHSYTAHLSPISTPRLFADISSRVVGDPNAFETPWVVRLFALDYVSQKVPDHPRFQQAWEFVHPIDVLRADDFAAVHGKAAKYVTGGLGSMAGASGTNEHNARHCHLTFVCPTRGVIHGLAGFFESVLYASQTGAGKEPVEISILPDQIDRKSRDMISWFPIFFPLKKPLYFPQDTELEVSMWRQTDDAKVWYEWLVEVYAWVGPNTRIKVGTSDLHSSRKVACLM
ncbi:PRMT5 arginine-N-methyltransferase-domain-containing protein [Parachaetomium inaequale]|uniref:Protein arginine N-methyltransferase n=1 Tax=Parachaetomium inaequale TaxID=2588326 RepID=A0AAN6PGI5_9PEZI|nr:PRMT5 arginine-N-methyltransferase-domain-containing protein [Parachaetomium inaequale]